MLGKYSLFCTKESRKVTQKKRSKLVLKDEEGKEVISCHLQHKPDKKYIDGSMCYKVKQGYSTENGTEPIYAIKAYRTDKNDSNWAIHVQRDAIVAVHCFRLFGISAYTFQHKNRHYLITVWLDGTDLIEAPVNHIKSYSIPQRIVMSIGLLKQVEILHSLGFIHGDIKPENVFLHSSQLQLIDLDSIRAKDYDCAQIKWNRLFTSRYLPLEQDTQFRVHKKNELHLLNEKTDIYAIGCTLMFLFPDIFVASIVNRTYLDPMTLNEYKSVSLKFTKSIHAVRHTKLQDLLAKTISFDMNTSLTATSLVASFLSLLNEYTEFSLDPSQIKSYKFDYALTPELGLNFFKQVDKKLLKIEDKEKKDSEDLSHNLQKTLNLK